MRNHEYLKLRFGNKERYVRVTGPNTGIRVNVSGEPWEKSNKDGVTREIIVFGPADVVCAMQMNLHYAELEPCEGRKLPEGK